MSKPRKQLLLIGAGPVHLAALHALRSQRPRLDADIELTLLTPDLYAPHPDMVAGLIAGHYRASECEIDVAALAASAGARLEQVQFDDMDLAHKTARADQREWAFDAISIDSGMPSPPAVITDCQQAIGIAPLAPFLQQWRILQDQVAQLEKPVHLVVVGGGLPAVELVLAMAHRLAQRSALVKWSLVAPATLLPGLPRRAAQLAERRLAQAGVAVRLATAVQAIDQDQLHFTDGTAATFDALIWACDNANPVPPWLSANGISCTEDGRILINRHAQSTSHPALFVAGEAARSHASWPQVPTANLLRQGRALAENLLRFLSDLPLAGHGGLPWRWQLPHDAPAFVALGPQDALATSGGMTMQGAWLWRWKDRRDREFVRRMATPVRAAPA